MEGIEIDKALEDLETRIERLRALYEQYFMGFEKIEPQTQRKEVDKLVTIFRREQIRNTAQRFKFQTLVQRYTTMQQYWGRVTREIENGTFRRDVIKAAARFGEKDALAAAGGKKNKQLAHAIALQAERGGRSREDDAFELDADDLIEEDVMAEEALADDPISAQSASRTPPPQSVQSAGGGLRWGGPSPSRSAFTAASSGVGSTGSTGSNSDPRSDIRTAEAQSGVKRRVAELAQAMKAAKTQGEGAPGFGALDLDFGESSGRVTPPPASPGRPIAPVAPITPPKVSPIGTPAGKPIGASPPAAQARPGAAGFGALDLPFEEDEAPTPASKQQKAPRITGVPASPAARPAAAPGARSNAPAAQFGAVDLELDPSAAQAASPASPRAPAGVPARPPLVSPGRPSPFGHPGRPSPFAPPGRPSPLASAGAPSAPGAQARPGPPAPALPPVQAPPAQRTAGAPAGPTPRPVQAPGASARPAQASAATASVGDAPKPAAPQPARAPVEPTAVSPRPAAPQPAGGDAALNDQRIRQIYSKYVDAKRAANESTAGVTYEKLAETLRAQAAKLRAAHPTKSVDYEVVMKDGRPHLKPTLK
ncbi:MAG: MXAN_5187 C-terminal domain-containing protein [Byssovorax sp.]